MVRIKRGKGNEWLLLKKKDAFAQPGWDIEDHAVSVLTGRTQEEIAQRPRTVRSRSRRTKAGQAHAAEHLADAGADRARELRPPATTGSTKSNGTASARSATSKTAASAWSPATATRWTANIPSCPSCRITSRRTAPRFSTAKSPRSTTAACPASSCSRAASTWPKPAPSRRLRRNIPVVFFVFDLLYLDGRDLRGEPLDRAKASVEGNP